MSNYTPRNIPVQINPAHHDGQFRERPHQEPTGTLDELLGAGVAKFYRCQHPSKHTSTTTYSTVVRCANSSVPRNGLFIEKNGPDVVQSAAVGMATICATCPLYTPTPAQSRNIWG